MASRGSSCRGAGAAPTDETEFIQLFSSTLKWVFARLPLVMDVDACAIGALTLVKAIFQHLPSQVAPATLKLGCNAWMLAPHRAGLICPF